MFVGRKLVTLLRDDSPDIPWPNCWDLPGGGREGDETPFQTVAREALEELSIVVTPNMVLWERGFVSASRPDHWHGFFVAQMAATQAQSISLGDEGQRWTMMNLDTFLAQPNRVTLFDERFAAWQAATGGLTSLPI